MSAMCMTYCNGQFRTLTTTDPHHLYETYRSLCLRRQGVVMELRGDPNSECFRKFLELLKFGPLGPSVWV
jgi:hypothetical protein